MITDQLCIFSDNVSIRATAVSNAVTVMPYMGKGDGGRVSVAVTEAYPATAAVSIAVQESKDGNTFTTLESHSVPQAKLTRTGSYYSFLLPSTLRAEKLRLSYTVTGSPATGRLWAGIAQDELSPYETGQYARAGKVVA